jgi:hypothetical protein
MNQFQNAPPPPPFAAAAPAIPPGHYLASDGKVYPTSANLSAPPPPVAAAAYSLPPLPAAVAFVPPAAAAPQGFSAPMPDTDLNGVTPSSGDALFPQVQGVYDLQIVSFAKRPGFKSGVAYWIGVKVLGSSAPEIPVGSVFSFLCPLAQGTKTHGDQRRKVILAAAYAQDPNAAIDWNALSTQTLGMHLDQQPLFAQLRMTTNFGKPMLDPNTKQPTGQYWCRETWLKAQPRA